MGPFWSLVIPPPITNLATPSPSSSRGSSIVAGSVDRTSRRLDVHYDVAVTLDDRASRLVARCHLLVRNRSSGPIDRLELRSAAKLPSRVAAATVDGREVSVAVAPGRLVVDLGGVLPDGASAEVDLDLTLSLGSRLTGDGWFHAGRDGIVQVAEWLPRVDPTFSDEIEAHVSAPAGMLVGIGALDHARELPIVASRRYRELKGTAGRTTIRILYLDDPAGRAAAAATLREARHALPWIERRLGPQPRDTITIAQVNSQGLAYSWPGIIWLPDHLTARGVRLYLMHELAHQWFGGIAAASDPRQDPFAGEGPAELISRLFLGGLRPSACPGRRLDLPQAAYGACFYEAVYVDGANLLDRIRRQMGDHVFWRALRGYIRQNQFRIVGTKDLLSALERATPVDLEPILRDRFRSRLP